MHFVSLLSQRQEEVSTAIAINSHLKAEIYHVPETSSQTPEEAQRKYIRKK
jgi:hypothetical protein